MKYIALLLAFLLPAANAGVFATSKVAPNGRVVVLYDEECPNTADPKRFKTDLLEPTGAVAFSGCWYSTGYSVDVIWSDGDTSDIPMQFFLLGSGKKSVPNT